VGNLQGVGASDNLTVAASIIGRICGPGNRLAQGSTAEST